MAPGRPGIVLDPFRTPVRYGWSPSAQRGCGLDSGRTLGRFRVLRQIGEGGMGTIYAAVDTRSGVEVAIKWMTAALGEEGHARLEREARALAAISHPNVVAFVDFCELDGDALLVMEFLNGTTLRELVRQAPLPHPRCVEIGLQIAAGLGAIHDAGLVHRDLKPENVQVTSSGLVKILDLGLSVPQDPVGEAAELAISGTVPYIAPELLRGRRADGRSDLFAVGVMLHELLTGVLPVLQRGSKNDAGSALEQAVRCCLRVRPEERFRSAGELAAALADASRSVPAEHGLAL